SISLQLHTQNKHGEKEERHGIRHDAAARLRAARSSAPLCERLSRGRLDALPHQSFQRIADLHSALRPAHSHPLAILRERDEALRRKIKLRTCMWDAAGN